MLRFTTTLLLSLVFFTAYSQDTTSIARDQEVQEVTIAGRKKEVVFAHSSRYIIDFSVSEAGSFILLNRFRKNYLTTLDEYMEPILTIELEVNPRQLYRDCLGNVHVVSKDSMFQIRNTGDSLYICERNSLALYHQFFKNCVGRNSKQVLFKEVKHFGKMVNYFGITRSNQEKTLLYSVSDSAEVADIIREYQLMRAEGYGHNQRMQEISLSQLEAMRDKEERKAFFHHVLSNPKYHPLFVVEDTTYVFDHLTSKVVVMDTAGAVLALNPIEYHKARKWQKFITHDPARDHFYTSYGRSASKELARLSEDFKVNRTTKIKEYQVIDKIMVYNGYAYYALRPNYEANLNKLYRQKL